MPQQQRPHVSIIGRKRPAPASVTTFSSGIPCLRRSSIKSTRIMELRTTIPAPAIKPGNHALGVMEDKTLRTRKRSLDVPGTSPEHGKSWTRGDGRLDHHPLSGFFNCIWRRQTFIYYSCFIIVFFVRIKLFNFVKNRYCMSALLLLVFILLLIF